MKLKRWSIVFIVAAFVATTALYGLKGTWAQSEPQIQVSGGTSEQIQLLAKGVGLSVPFNITCTGTEQVGSFFERLEVRQRVGGGALVVAEDSVDSWEVGSTLICNGQPQTVAVKTLVPWGSTFKKGTALVTGFVQVCGLTDMATPEYPSAECARADISQEVRIK